MCGREGERGEMKEGGREGGGEREKNTHGDHGEYGETEADSCNHNHIRAQSSLRASKHFTMLPFHNHTDPS